MANVYKDAAFVPIVRAPLQKKRNHAICGVQRLFPISCVFLILAGRATEITASSYELGLFQNIGVDYE